MYHCVYRILKILTNFNRAEFVELERLMIWDFYVLFPERVYEIRLGPKEKEIKTTIKTFINKTNNPYLDNIDSKNLFDRVKPYQLNALKCLSSYGLINTDYRSTNRVSLGSGLDFSDDALNLIRLSSKEKNVISLMVLQFFGMPLYGAGGLKDRSGLIEYKYDA